MPPVAFLIDSIGPGEILVVLVVTLLLFGAKRLPEMARTLGKTAETLRRAYQDVADEITREPPDDPTHLTPPPPELERSEPLLPSAPEAQQRPEQEKPQPHDPAG